MLSVYEVEYVIHTNGILCSDIWGILTLWCQFSSVAQSCPTLCDPMDCSMPAWQGSIINSQSLLKMSIESVMPPSHLIICHALLLLPSIFPSIRVSSNESPLHRIMWPKYCSFRKDLASISQDVLHYPAITTQNLSSSTQKSWFLIAHTTHSS